MAFAAQTGGIPAPAWWLFAANVLWAVAYDTFYALVDIADDRRIGVKSTAILFGDRVGPVTAVIQIAVLASLAVAGQKAGLGAAFYAGLAAAAALAAYQQLLIRGREPARCFKAFLNNSRFGAVVFLGIAADYLLR
jgi:4-hydroxybenzoate polyprenyltransferase